MATLYHPARNRGFLGKGEGIPFPTRGPFSFGAPSFMFDSMAATAKPRAHNEGYLLLGCAIGHLLAWIQMERPAAFELLWPVVLVSVYGAFGVAALRVRLYGASDGFALSVIFAFPLVASVAAHLVANFLAGHSYSWHFLLYVPLTETIVIVWMFASSSSQRAEEEARTSLAKGLRVFALMVLIAVLAAILFGWALAGGDLPSSSELLYLENQEVAVRLGDATRAMLLGSIVGGLLVAVCAFPGRDSGH